MRACLSRSFSLSFCVCVSLSLPTWRFFICKHNGIWKVYPKGFRCRIIGAIHACWLSVLSASKSNILKNSSIYKYMLVMKIKHLCYSIIHSNKLLKYMTIYDIFLLPYRHPFHLHHSQHRSLCHRFCASGILPGIPLLTLVEQ